MIEQVVNATILVLIIAILARALLSWFPGIIDPRGSIAEFLFTITEPILGPIRSILPSLGGFDLSPMIAIFVLGFLRSFIDSRL